jgi:hypothetical protein
MVPCCNVKVAAEIDEGFIASLNVAVALALSGTSAAAFEGAIDVTVGATVSAVPELPLPPHPATKLIRRSAVDLSSGFVVFKFLFIFLLS